MNNNQQDTQMSAKFLLKLQNSINELRSDFDKLSDNEKKEVKSVIELGLGIKIISRDF